MEKQTNQTNIYTALLEAQKAFGPVLKNATNPAFRSKYADLSAVIETITEPLHNAGVLFTQPLVVVDGDQHIKTVFIHAESGTRDESLYRVVSKDSTDPQKVGGAITYGRRYSLLSALGLAPEDDDGNHASTPASASSAPAKAATAPTTNKSTGEVYDDPDTTPDGECTHCGAFVKGKSVYWSNRKHGRTLCWDCQQMADRGELGELGDPDNDIRTQGAEKYKDGAKLPF